MKTLPLLICAALLGSVTAASPLRAAQAVQPIAKGDVASRVAALNALLAEQWQYNLKNAPEFATTLGDLRYNDRWTDASLAHQAADHRRPRISSSASRRSIPAVSPTATSSTSS